MKSNVILESKDRILFGITIRQDTQKEFLSLSDLQESYTIARLKNGWSDRRINDILSSNTSSERVYYILKERGFIEAGISAFMDEVQKTSLVKVMKKYGAYKTIGRGENRTTMCEKYIWIMLALELNPEIYAKVVCWIGDSLIINRIEAGDKYNDLCRACSKFKDVDYRIIAKGLNYIIFNVHETLIRNKATQLELKELDYLQRSLAFSVDMGYIKSFEELHNTMKMLWYNKWGNLK